MPYPVITTGSKLSIHGILPGQTIPFIQRGLADGIKFPVVKSTTDVGVLIDTKKLSPTSITVFRYVNPDDACQDIDRPGYDYAGVVSRTIAGIKDRIRSAEEWASVDYIECFNEADPPGILGYTNMAKLMIMLMDAWKLEGKRQGLMFTAFNAGTPEYNEMQAFAATGIFEKMKAGGHILSVHEGAFSGPIQGGFKDTIPGAPVGSGVTLKAGSMTFRYRFIHDLMAQRGCGDVPIFISEWYYFDGLQAGNAEMQKAVAWYDAEVANDSYVIGFAPFTIGPIGGWLAQDFTPFYPALMDYMKVVKTRQNATSATVPTPIPPIPTPEPIPPTPVPTPPATKFKVGLHMRANGRNLPADFTVVRDARIEAVKLLTSADPTEVAQFKALKPDMLIMARLFASFTGRKVTSGDFLSWMIPEFKPFYDRGVRLVEIHNEPNLRSEGLGLSWLNGTQFGQWFIEVYTGMKREFPLAQFGWPGLSPGGSFDNGTERRMDEWLFWDSAQAAVALADFVCLHSYWQSEAEFNTTVGGNHYQEYLKRTTKPLYVTEFSNASTTPAAEKGAQYVRYYQRLAAVPQVKAAFAFVVSAPSGFVGEVWRNEAGQANAIVQVVGARPATVPPVTPTPLPPLKPGDLKPVTGSDWNQRAQPNDTARVQGVLKKDTTVLVKEISPDGKWVRVETVGWVSREAFK